MYDDLAIASVSAQELFHQDDINKAYGSMMVGKNVQFQGSYDPEYNI